MPVRLSAWNNSATTGRIFMKYDTPVMHVKFTYVFVLGRNYEILILVKPGRDRSVTTATVSSTNQLEPGSHLIGSLYF